MYSHKFRTMSRVLALAFVASLPCSLVAQVAASQGKGNPNAPAPKWNVFVGYSILDPRGTFYPIQPDGTTLPASFKLEKEGMVESAAWFFRRNVGIEFESGQHDLFVNTGFNSTGSSNSGIFTAEGGLLYRWPGIHFTPYVHGLAGAADIDGPDHEPYTWGPVIVVGGGLDWYPLCHNIGIRLFDADYEYLHANSGLSHGTLAANDFVWGDDESINAIRVSAGIVFRGASYYGPVVGCGPVAPLAMACVATPSSVFPGEPVTVTAAATGLNPKETATYSWSGAGAAGNSEVVTVPTAGLGPGTYTVRSTVTQGTKNPQIANCEASFTVRAWEPPSLSCVAGPMTINPDQTSTITLTGQSPQNLPLTYSCTSTGGLVTMNGNTATFSANGAAAGPVTINCSVADNKGHTSAANCSLAIVAPPVHENPHVLPLCSIDFGRDKQRPTRVDNEAKACLDAVALALQQHPDNTLLVVGEAANTEGQGSVDAQRAVNTKNYLTTEKGIDPSRITVVTGNEGTQGVEEYLVPPGAVYTSDVQHTNVVNETVVQPQERKPLPMRQHVHRNAAAKTPATLTHTKKPTGSVAPATSKKKKPVGSLAPAKGTEGP